VTARSYERPESLAAALDLLPRREWTILAGGTDVYPAAAEAFAWGRPGPAHVLDVSAIAGLGAIEETADAFRIGCLATWQRIVDSDLPDWFRCLRLAGREIGGAQIQNRATLAGNICNASPAADGVPALLALDARVELHAASGARIVALSDFILGNRQTARGRDELVTAILVPKRGPSARSTFLKLGARRYLVISIAMVAAAIDADESGRIDHARIAVGACSEVAARLPALERALIGKSLDEPLEDLVEDAMVAPLSPIADVRGSAEYRRNSALVLARRALAALRTQEETAR
jgi:CO/xanthine dehydrogenase FAD-binding subunit